MTNHPNRSRVSVDRWPDYLKRFRKKHGLTQEELGLHLMTPAITIRKWEMGLHNPPPFLKLALITVAHRLAKRTLGDILALSHPGSL